MKKKLFPVPTRKELVWGYIYLFLQWLILPVLLVIINAALAEPLSLMTLNCVLFIVNFIATALIFSKFLRLSLKKFFQNVAESLGTALIGLGLYLGGNLVVSMVILAVDPNFANVNDANVAGMVSENFPLMAVCTILLVPVAEELLYRGLLFGGMHNKSPLLAYLLSAVIFSLIHVIAYIGMYPLQTLLLCILQYIVPSLVLAWSWKKSGNIVTPMLIHIIINAVGIFAMR